jgi:hypothetical protein
MVNLDLYLLNAQVEDIGILKQLVVPSNPWFWQAASQPGLVLFWHPTEAKPHSMIILLLINLRLHLRSAKRRIV